MKKHALIIGDVDSVNHFLDFQNFNYSIITSKYEYNFMPSAVKAAASNIYQVETSSNFDATCFEKSIEEIVGYVKEITEKSGKINCVISTHEHTVLPAATIRSKFDIDGLKIEQGISLRDKNEMKSKVNEYGILTPDFKHLDKDCLEDSVKKFIEKYKKIVVKPSNQAGSYNLLISDDLEESLIHAQKLLNASNKVTIEQYIDLPIMHFDGVAIKGNVKFLSVSKKMGTCYDYVTNRENLTTIIVKDSNIYKFAKDYVTECLKALRIENLVFHLEVFNKNNEEFLFLEIAGRYPGSGITTLINKVFNFDMVKASYYLDSLMISDKDFSYKELKDIKPTGMMLVPTPQKKNFRIRGIRGLDNLPKNLIKSDFYGPGNTINFSPIDAFKSVASFWVSDNDPSNIENSIKEIENQLKIYLEEVE
ncbi:acetyl-CoA carboxylase biotin carboxylase subunit family protein [Priestia aryabhattai]|uniref:ATP-grasp domain-containing protein n=1 Tax=Priestia TaxID=2800373 RepID=UPI0039838797